MARLFSYNRLEEFPVVEITEKVLSSWEFRIDKDDEFFEVYSSEKKSAILETMKKVLRLIMKLDESFQFIVPLVYTESKTLTLYSNSLFMSMIFEGEKVLDCGLGSIIDTLEYIDKEGEISISFIEKKIEEGLVRNFEDFEKYIEHERHLIDVFNKEIEKLENKVEGAKGIIEELKQGKTKRSELNSTIRGHFNN